MKRKTSTLPTRVFKYGLLPPIVGAELVDDTLAKRRIYYNQLVTIENRRRHLYRRERSRLFPAYEETEKQYHELDERVLALDKAIKEEKSRSRSRKVPKPMAKEMAEVKLVRREVATRLKDLRAKAKDDPSLIAAAAPIDEAAREAVKALRPSLYWGTYLLVEAEIKQAAKTSRGDLSYNEDPCYQLTGRLGVQVQGGIGLKALATDTQIQIDVPEFPIVAKANGRVGPKHLRGKAARTKLRLRVASTEKGRPVWAEFPMIMHRPLPADANIKEAYVTRRPHGVRTPWKYDLCIVLESAEFDKYQPVVEQKGTLAINFGWRLIDGGLRVATINKDAGKNDGDISEIRLPAKLLQTFGLCRGLRRTLDLNFDKAKAELSKWIEENECPMLFCEDFENLGKWKSQRRLADLVYYWQSHRFPGDEAILSVMSHWKERYRHLADWKYHQYHRALRWRDDFYMVEAKKLVASAERIVIDTFEIAKIARRPEAEEETKGGQAERTNRTMASPGDLREKILRACKKYRCEALAAPTKDNTTRCNECGEIYEWDQAKELVHTCPEASEVAGETCSTWDQDVNNTKNLHGHVASGDVMTIVPVAPVVQSSRNSVDANAKMPSASVPLGAARKALGKRLKTKKKTEQL